MKRTLWIDGLAAAVLLFGIFAYNGIAAAGEGEACLECHGDSATVGTALTIDQAAFAATPHAALGCLACHEGVGADHPDDGAKPPKAQCGTCHETVAKEYASSTHAGNAACVDCHNPHAVRAQDEVSGYDMNRRCASCHDEQELMARHRQWLPRTATHLAALPCISCHTNSEKLVLDLYLTRKGVVTAAGDFELATYKELATLTKGADVSRLVDLDGNGTVSIDELRAFNSRPGLSPLGLQGMMVPAQPSHGYGILYNRWDCTFCHGTGPSSLATSYLSVPNPDGSYRRLPVERGAVLSVLYTTPDFYMVGATRNMALNIVGVMIIAGGLVMPVGHGLLRFLTRKNRS